MPPLPDCLTKIDASFVEPAHKPRRLYEVIISRHSHGAWMPDNTAMVWSSVAPVRCVLTREALDQRVRDGFRACILREFDHA